MELLPTPDPYTGGIWGLAFGKSGLAWLLVTVGCIAAVVVLARRLRRHRLVRIGLIIPLIPALLVLWPISRALVFVHPRLSLAALIVIVIFLIARSLTGFGATFRKRLWIPALILLPLFYAASVLLNMGKEGDRCAQVEHDPRIRTLFSLCDPGWRQGLYNHTPPPFRLRLSPNPRTIFPSADGSAVYLGSGLQEEASPQPLIKVRRDTGEIESVRYLYTPWRGECAPQRECARADPPTCTPHPPRCFLLSWMKRSLLVIDDRSNTLEAEIRFQHHDPLSFAMDPVGGRLLAAREYNPTSHSHIRPTLLNADVAPRVILADPEGPPADMRDPFTVFSVDWDTLEVRSYQQNIFTGPICFALFDPADGRLFLAPQFLNFRLWFASGPSLQLDSVPIGALNFIRSGGIVTGIAHHPGRKEVYLAYPLEGAVYIFDTDPPVWKGRIPVEPGVRELAVDTEADLLFVGGYLSGTIRAIDLSTRTVVRSIFVGRKVRQIRWDPERHSLLVTSANGFLEVDAHHVREDWDPS